MQAQAAVDVFAGVRMDLEGMLTPQAKGPGKSRSLTAMPLGERLPS